MIGDFIQSFGLWFFDKVDIPGTFLVFIATCLLAALTVMVMRGRWRWVAWSSVLPLIVLVLYTLYGLFLGSNLWPLMLLLLAPFVFLYMLAVWALWGLYMLVMRNRKSEEETT